MLAWEAQVHGERGDVVFQAGDRPGEELGVAGGELAGTAGRLSDGPFAGTAELSRPSGDSLGQDIGHWTGRLIAAIAAVADLDDGSGGVVVAAEQVHVVVSTNWPGELFEKTSKWNSP